MSIGPAFPQAERHTTPELDQMMATVRTTVSHRLTIPFRDVITCPNCAARVSAAPGSRNIFEQVARNPVRPFGGQVGA